MVNVRNATHKNIDWIMTELKEFAKFFGSKHSLYGDEEYVRNGLEILIDDHILLIAEDDLGLTGFIAALVLPHIFNPNIKTVIEIFWWVPEEHRHTRSGFLLLKELIKASDELGASWITMGLQNGTDVKEESLAKLGFHLHERNFLREI